MRMLLTGLFFVIPCTDVFDKVDLRIVSFDVPPQEVISCSPLMTFLFHFAALSWPQRNETKKMLHRKCIGISEDTHALLTIAAWWLFLIFKQCRSNIRLCRKNCSTCSIRYVASTLLLVWTGLKTAKSRITQTMPYDNPGTLVFCCQKSRRKYKWVTPNGGARGGVGSNRRFSTNISLYLRNGARQRHS